MIGAPDYKYNVSIFLFNTLVSLKFFEAKSPETINLGTVESEPRGAYLYPPRGKVNKNFGAYLAGL